ncbi:MAG: hypothetical protein HF967_10440, partial [Methanosarcinales archaeon]|nr:hypothetical protein [Methanosarcinales archaeon]
MKNEEFYDKLIKALKSEDKIFKLEGVSVSGTIEINEIYEKIENDDNLKHLILIENDKKIVYLDVNIGIENVIFNNNVKFYDENNKICVKFKNIQFHDTIFKEMADFSSSTFKENTDFRSSTFEGEADFSSSIFEGEADFSSSIFEGEADFSSSIFEG